MITGQPFAGIVVAGTTMSVSSTSEACVSGLSGSLHGPCSGLFASSALVSWVW
jgi:hypothetical protein